ncbi:Ectopic P granules protein 5 [Mactra antiquata]
MAEAIRPVKRKSKVKEKHEAPVESESDISAGVPDVSDLQDLLKQEEDDKFPKNKIGTVSETINQEAKIIAETNNTSNVGDDEVKLKDRGIDQTDVCKTKVDSVVNVQDDSGKDTVLTCDTSLIENDGNLVDASEVGNEEPSTSREGVIQTHAHDLAEKSETRHLYPDLSEQLQQFLQEEPEAQAASVKTIVTNPTVDIQHDFKTDDSSVEQHANETNVGTETNTVLSNTGTISNEQNETKTHDEVNVSANNEVSDNMQADKIKEASGGNKIESAELEVKNSEVANGGHEQEISRRCLENESSVQENKSSAPLEADLQPRPEAHVIAHRQVVAERKDEFQPLTQEQLNTLYYNARLENNQAYIDRFIQAEMTRENHEFYEILMNYQRARKNLLQCEAALKTYEEEYRKSCNEVWITETKTQTVKGMCGDNFHCTATHTYCQAHVDYNALSRMTLNLKNIQDQIHNELSLHSYSDQLSRLQVESYIHNLYVSSPDLRDIPKNFPVTACDRQSDNVTHQIQKLQECISILFTFHRLPIDDKVFRTDLQTWTERMVSTLLRVGTYEDHLCILNQIMRCPAGIGSWAAHLVQVPSIPSNENLTFLMFGNSCLDHVITGLSTVLIPTSYRSEFLCKMQKVLTTGKDNKNLSWVLVDSDGEEDEDPQTNWMYLHENDVVAILKQFPIASVFKHVFFIVQSNTGESIEYDINKTSESTMYRVFAFSSCLIKLLGNGLKTYNMSRYRQLNKRLGKMIRQCVQFISDHWKNFTDSKQGVLSVQSINKLQVEYDAFFLRAVNYIHISQRLGSWQFIADMPFDNVSKGTMWKILWLLHQGQGQSFDLGAIPSANVCMEFVKDPSCRSQLSDLLQRVPASEGVYLLNTMTNMTECLTSADIDFIETVTMSVFEVSYVCPETRDICSKIGRELLSAVITCHPFMMSHLTQKVHENMEKLGQMGLYLYKGISLDTWLPTDQDLSIIHQWLLNSNLSSPENHMAQQILNNINWGRSAKCDKLMVPWYIHKQVAVMVVEGFQKFIFGKHIGSMIMDGVKQVSAAVQQSYTTEQEFNTWCWELLRKLSLHRDSLPCDDRRLADGINNIPNVNTDDSLLPLCKGIKEKNPAACYVTMLLTKYGHSIGEFMSEGLSLLEVLTTQGLYKPLIHALFYNITMFIENQKSIIDSIRFQQVLVTILQADDSYLRAVKGLLSNDFPGPITKQLTSMIQGQVEVAGQTSNETMTMIVSLWIKIILKIPKWFQDRNCCCLLDDLIKLSFTRQPVLQTVMNIFNDTYKEFRLEQKNQGVVSSLMNWVTSGVTLPTFLDKSSCGEFSWLTYAILTVEGNYEHDTKLWSSLQEEMLMNDKQAADSCLKKCIMKLKLDQAPIFSRLNIYRWGQQALDMPIDHPITSLIWQQFFVLFLGRLHVTQSNIPQRASVGERFFTGFGYSGILKKMKKRLGQTADHYTKQGGQETSVDNVEDSSADGSKKSLYYKLARLYQTLQLWVEEPLLHDATLYLPSLPPQYQSDRLLNVFYNRKDPWFEFVDIFSVKTGIQSVISDWVQSTTVHRNPMDNRMNESQEMSNTAADRILLRLLRLDVPLPPPPLYPVKAPVPEISTMIVEDQGAILHLLQSDLNILKEYAGKFCTQLQHHKSVDDAFIDITPSLYKNVDQQVNVQLKCTSLVNPFHKCSKPTFKTVNVKQKWNDTIKQRQSDENRADYKQIIIDCTQPPSQNIVVCAVHVENAITMLVKIYRSCTDYHRRLQLADTACKLFFQMGDTVSESTRKYPPTKQFFASCIDVLGKDFIQIDARQTEHVLTLALHRPEIGGLLSPHFLPILSPESFVTMYVKLIEVLKSTTTGQTSSRQTNKNDVGIEVVCMLLTKFEILKWLTDYNPSKQEVKKFIEHLSQAFISCGTNPKDELETVFILCRSHEKTLLNFRFPLYLHEILAALLQGSSIQRINVSCWETLLNVCFYSNQDSTARVGCYPEISSDLSIEEIRNILQWLGHEFMNIRQNQKDAISFGLYPVWKLYVPHLSTFIQDLCKCLIDKMLPNITDTPTNEGFDRLWQIVIECFAPWIQTICIKNVTYQPWIPEDRDIARHMVKALSHIVGYAHYKTEDVRGRFYNDFLSHTWLYFATILCNPNATADVISVFNIEFVTLPWKQFMPNIHVMETMAKLKEVGNSLGFNLVADILGSINWNHILSWYESFNSRELLVRFEGFLYILLIQCFAEKKYMENPDIQQLLTQSQTFKWQNLSATDYKGACSWFLQACDPVCLLKGRTSPEALGLRLLETASGFTVEISQMLTEDWYTKRLTYLHTIISLICQCTYLTDIDTLHLSTVIINLLTETETVETAVCDPHTRLEESTDMMKEILSLLNNSNPEYQGANDVMTTILEWLKGSPKTILLSPCIHAASRNLASLFNMVQIVEQCISLSFVSTGDNANAQDSWNSVLAAVQIPELNVQDFFQICLQYSSFLLLYCYVIQRLPLCQSLAEEQTLIETILDWTEKAKPSSENESKLLLWWYKSIELIMRQLDYGRDPATCVTLTNKFIHKVQGYGEDRASAGLLGAIGLGKKSSLSEKFRVCSRALVAFCSRQVVDENKFRLSNTDPVSTTSSAKQDSSHLLALKSNKKYQPIKTDVELICDFVTDQSKCLKDVFDLFKLLIGRFYSDMEYLNVLK